MRFLILVITILSLLILKVKPLSILEKAVILRDYPLCATICSRKVSKKLGVRYFDGRGNCARPEYQYQWKQCIKKGCFRKDRQKVRHPRFVFHGTVIDS